MLDEKREKEFQNKVAQCVIKAVCGQSVCKTLKVYLRDGLNVECCNEYGVRFLVLAAIHGKADACEVLIAHGANVGRADINGTTPLIKAAELANTNVIRILLTTIPPEVTKSIRQCMPGLIWARSKFGRDVGKLVAQKLVDMLVADQMPRIENLIAHKYKKETGDAGVTARELALEYSQQSWRNPYEQKALKDVARMLDLSDSESRTLLLRQLEAHVKRILFGEPETVIIRRKNQWYHTDKFWLDVINTNDNLV